jgi:ABC-type transport system involved in multi-copper enzyme maturation permease subunit
MLWYKAWLDTRARFLVSLCGMVALSSFGVYHGEQSALSYAKADYYYSMFHGAHNLLSILWVMAVTLLMMGGLLREKAAGVSAFTLALPVSRTRLMRVRILMGLCQAMALIVIPWVAMLLVGRLTGKIPLLSQAGFHMILLASGGLLFFAIALLISSLIEGEYTAPIVTFGSMIGLGVALVDPPFLTYNPWRFILGAEYWDKHSSMLTGPLPWTMMAAWLSIAAVLTVLSITLIEKREF